MIKKLLVMMMVSLCLCVSVSLYAKKPRIAISDFVYKAGGATGNWAVGEGISDMLATSLVKSGKYDVYERTKMEALIEEQKLGLTGLTTPESAAKMGKLLGVQFVVIGSINQFGMKEEGGKAFGININSVVARVGADIRIVNVESSKIMAAESGKGEENATGISIDNLNLLPTEIDFGSRGFDDTIIGKATKKCVDDLIDKMNKAFGSAGTEGKIMKVTDNKAYINLGKDSGITVGALFDIMRKGEDLVDPDTGENLGSEDTKIGIVKIIEIKEKYSIAEIIDGKSKIAQNDIAILKK